MAEADPDAAHLNLKRFWHDTFEEMFEDFRTDKWTLSPTDKEVTGKGWRTLQDKAKETQVTLSLGFPCLLAQVKFLCAECGRSWTSMRGQVIFWYRLDRERKKGSLRFKLFRQRCNKDTQTFQNARWYREEIKKVLSNVHQEIGETYYGFKRNKPDDSQRRGAPRRPHNESMCEACDMGVCTQTR